MSYPAASMVYLSILVRLPEKIPRTVETASAPMPPKSDTRSIPAAITPTQSGAPTMNATDAITRKVTVQTSKFIAKLSRVDVILLKRDTGMTTYLRGYPSPSEMGLLC